MAKNPFEAAGLKPIEDDGPSRSPNPFEAAGLKAIEAPGEGEALLRGGAQGLSLGFSDEITGGLGALFDAKAGEGLADAYARHRDESRAANDAAKEAHSGLYGGAELAGSVGSMFIPGLNVAKGAKLAATVGKAALAGGLSGAGYSTADTVGGVAADSALGGALGAGAGTVGHGIGKGLEWVGGLASKGIARGEQKALDMATKPVAQEVKSAVGSFGGKSQDTYRSLEKLKALKESLTPDDQAFYQTLIDDGTVARLEQRAGHNTLADLPSKLGELDASEAAMRAALEGKDAAIEEGKKKILGWEGFKEQAVPRLTRYGLPALGGALGLGNDDPLWGLAGGALMGAGARPMMHSLIRGAKHPAVATPFLKALRGVSGVGADSAAQASSVAQRNYARMFPNMSPALGLAEDEQDPLAQR